MAVAAGFSVARVNRDDARISYRSYSCGTQQRIALRRDNGRSFGGIAVRQPRQSGACRIP
jgi:hypothetical protein